MPDREFIHATADVPSTLIFAINSGLQVMQNTQQTDPRPHILDRSEIDDIQKGDFYLFRPEWVFGPFELSRISEGHDRGKFFVRPRVNFTAVSVYFQGERVDEGRRRFGSCAISSHRDWLEVPGNVVRPIPAAVDEWFKRIVAHLSSGVFVEAGVHRYHLSKGVKADPGSDECLPPFDYIPWPV